MTKRPGFVWWTEDDGGATATEEQAHEEATASLCVNLSPGEEDAYWIAPAVHPLQAYGPTAESVGRHIAEWLCYRVDEEAYAEHQMMGVDKDAAVLVGRLVLAAVEAVATVHVWAADPEAPQKAHVAKRARLVGPALYTADGEKLT